MLFNMQGTKKEKRKKRSWLITGQERCSPAACWHFSWRRTIGRMVNDSIRSMPPKQWESLFIITGLVKVVKTLCGCILQLRTQFPLKVFLHIILWAERTRQTRYRVNVTLVGHTASAWIITKKQCKLGITHTSVGISKRIFYWTRYTRHFKQAEGDASTLWVPHIWQNWCKRNYVHLIVKTTTGQVQSLTKLNVTKQTS